MVTKMRIKDRADRGRAGIIGAAILLLAAGIVFFAGRDSREEEPVYRPIRGFSNMCAYDGKVYAGVNAPYGEPIRQESSIFTMWEDKIYYVEKVQEAYDSLTDELLEIKRSDPDGSHEETLAGDVFLAGAGHEKLVGDKLFYGYEYDENYRMRYACVDVNTKERRELASDRIDEILGYDGNYVYYKGMDAEDGNLLGRIHLKTGRDETVVLYGPENEQGYIENVSFADGKFYCFTLAQTPEGYDYRTYIYRLQIRNGETGEVEKEIPVDFTGSSNYSVLIWEDEAYMALAGDLVAVSMEGGIRKIGSLKEGEYWGIMHFIPGDGYLYYEAIAETDEETGNNDYFYRIPVSGGESELLKEWFTVSEIFFHFGVQSCYNMV